MRQDLAALLDTTPREHGLEGTRWRCADLIGYLFGIGSRSGVWRTLQRWGFRYRQGWGHLVSPDPWASEKLAWLAAVQTRVERDPEHNVLLWLDEVTCYRLPTPASTWWVGNHRAMKMRLRPGSNTKLRVVAALNVTTGQVEALLRSQVGVRQLQQFYAQLRTAYPDAQEIYVAQDCWPVHFLPEVVTTACQLGITLVPLPTYSSWRNPIEKLWRWLRQEVIHMHRWADDWPRFKQAVHDFIDRFHAPSRTLLCYVGLAD